MTPFMCLDVTHRNRHYRPLRPGMAELVCAMVILVALVAWVMEGK